MAPSTESLHAIGNASNIGQAKRLVKNRECSHVIDHANVLEVYKRVSLLDLSGINTRFQARLNAYGIFTPIEFYNAPLELLKK